MDVFLQFDILGDRLSLTAWAADTSKLCITALGVVSGWWKWAAEHLELIHKAAFALKSSWLHLTAYRLRAAQVRVTRTGSASMQRIVAAGPAVSGASERESVSPGADLMSCWGWPNLSYGLPSGCDDLRQWRKVFWEPPLGRSCANE